MKIVFHIAHPSQFYIFKSIIANIGPQHEIIVTYTYKDILAKLIDASELNSIAFPVESNKSYRSSSTVYQILTLIDKERGLAKIVRKFRPHLIIGTSIVITHVAKLFNAKSIILDEDDFDIIKLSARIGYPFVNHVLCPKVIRTGKWSKKAIGYNGYQKLIYLHPSVYQSNEDELSKLINLDEDYSILRFAKLTAHHDVGIKGLDISLVRELMKRLDKIGKVYISSEIELPADLRKHELRIPLNYIHTLLDNAKVLISDSQSMSMEAAMLGTPSIRFNDFAGRISVLEELEKDYGLTFGIKTDYPEKLLEKTDELLHQKDLRVDFKHRRNKMLNDKIDVLRFVVWFINEYPSSAQKLEEEPTFVDNAFKTDI